MAKPTMPEIASKTSKVGGRGNWIEITKAITSHEKNPYLKVKYRETERIKGNRNIIFNSELSHKNNFFNNLWCV
jgi:hypothetical protein